MKKHLIVLPGNSAQNRAWGEAFLSHYEGWFDSIYLQEYGHWQNEGENINFALEESVLKSHIAANVAPDTKVVVMAKSAGAILAFLASESGIIKPTQVFFFGIPFDFAVVDVWHDNWSAVAKFNFPAIAFHNEHDPIADFAFTREALKKHAPQIPLITTEDTNHAYNRFELYDPHILPLLTTL